MPQSVEKIVLPPPFPDHTQLPEEDGTFVKNFQEHPQSLLLTDSIDPVLQALHPDGCYAISSGLRYLLARDRSERKHETDYMCLGYHCDWMAKFDGLTFSGKNIRHH